MPDSMTSPSSSPSPCPDLLVPVMANVLASRPIIDSLDTVTLRKRTQADLTRLPCCYRQTVELTRAEYDELMILFNRTQPFTVPLRSSQKVCTVTFASPPILAKPWVSIKLRKLASSTRLKLGEQTG